MYPSLVSIGLTATARAYLTFMALKEGWGLLMEFRVGEETVLTLARICFNPSMDK